MADWLRNTLIFGSGDKDSSFFLLAKRHGFYLSTQYLSHSFLRKLNRKPQMSLLCCWKKDILPLCSSPSFLPLVLPDCHFNAHSRSEKTCQMRWWSTKVFHFVLLETWWKLEWHVVKLENFGQASFSTAFHQLFAIICLYDESYSKWDCNIRAVWCWP